MKTIYRNLLHYSQPHTVRSIVLSDHCIARRVPIVFTAVILLAVAAVCWPGRCAAATAPTRGEGEAQNPQGAPAEAIDRWRQLKFGLFIHWGPVSLKGTEVGWSRGEMQVNPTTPEAKASNDSIRRMYGQVPVAEYDNLYKQFNPVKFNANEWAKLAKEAGMKYMVPVAKHMDGFCMFDTKETDYNIMRSPFGRDVTKELAMACRKQGISFGLYYALSDFYESSFGNKNSFGGPSQGRPRRPDANRYQQFVRKQLEELIRNYGPLATLWFDAPTSEIRGQETIDFIRALQADITVNNRSGGTWVPGPSNPPGDYDTPEQTVGGMQTKRPWETCMTIGTQWSWKPDDKMKSLKECLQALVNTVCNDGNFLFNVGPMPNGLIEPRQAERLKEMGQWLGKYGESIYGTRGGPFRANGLVGSTYRNNIVYVHILNPSVDTIRLLPIAKKIIGHRVLTGSTATIKQSDTSIEITVSKTERQEIDTIVVLQLDGPAIDAHPRAPSSGSVAAFKKAQASSIYNNLDEAHGPALAFDDDPDTRWTAGRDAKQAWLEVDLGEPQKINQSFVSELYNRVQQFEIQIKSGDSWQTVARGKAIGPELKLNFPPVTAQILRLNITLASATPLISEFRLFAVKE